MKEPNHGLMAYNLLDAATALAGILDQPVEGKSIKVNYQYASRLICDLQVAAKSVADQLMFIKEEGGAR